MRIIGGAWRGRRLQAPPGQTTRPTAERLRQAMFDMLMHAPWGGRALLEGAHVLDAFAGTGATGLEALSRGAAYAVFIECDAHALAALRANVAACTAGEQSRILAADVLKAGPGTGQAIAFLDPPYGQDLLSPALAALRAHGWIVPGTVVLAESGRLEPVPADGIMLAQRAHGAGRMNVWREV